MPEMPFYEVLDQVLGGEIAMISRKRRVLFFLILQVLGVVCLRCLRSE